MTRPDPQVGQVVRYEYLWASDEFQGRSEGNKFRPCAIVAAILPGDGKPLRAMVCGITHTPPRAPSQGIELSVEDKTSLGLDSEPSWVIVSEVNTVNWSDRRFIPAPSDQWTYGNCSRPLMEAIRRAIGSGIKSASMEFLDRPNIDERTRAK